MSHYVFDSLERLRGQDVRVYKDIYGRRFVAVCDVLHCTSYVAAYDIVGRLSKRACACLAKPDGDRHKKWLALYDEVLLKLDVQSESFEDETPPCTERLTAAQAKLQDRIDKHDRDIERMKERVKGLTERIEANERGRKFLQELLADIS